MSTGRRRVRWAVERQLFERVRGVPPRIDRSQFALQADDCYPLPCPGLTPHSNRHHLYGTGGGTILRPHINYVLP